MSDYALQRRTFVQNLLAARGDALVVAGLGSPTYDVAAAGDCNLNFYLWGAMGAASMIGLGLALAQPDRRVVVITGDGEMLMGMGSLATIGVKQPANLSVVVLDNQRYGETGMQASHTASGVNLAAIARACQFKEVLEVSDESQLEAAKQATFSAQGPAFIHARIAATDDPRVLPERDGVALKLRFMQALGV